MLHKNLTQLSEFQLKLCLPGSKYGNIMTKNTTLGQNKNVHCYGGVRQTPSRNNNRVQTSASLSSSCTSNMPYTIELGNVEGSKVHNSQ